MIAVELAPEVDDALRRMNDLGAQPKRCHSGVVRSAIAAALSRLLEDSLGGGVRPWDLPQLERGAADLGAVEGARAVRVDPDVMVAELVPGGERLVFRGVDDDWRLVRFAAGTDYTVRPETTRTVELRGDGPDSVLAALGVAKPDSVTMTHENEYLGQGESEYRSGYYWTEGTRSFLAEEVTNEIFDGATPRSSYLRGLIIDDDGGTLLHGGDGRATVIEG